MTELETQALNTSAIRVRWSSPECPYGVVTSYTVFYRQADTPQTGDINSDGYITDTVDSSVEEYVLSGLTVFTNSIHVQAINAAGIPSAGEITQEVVERTEKAGEFIASSSACREACSMLCAGKKRICSDHALLYVKF